MNETNILIVEDEGIVADEIRVRLKNLGYNVVGISSRGEDAVKKAMEKRPDLVLMDIRLKGDMDGIQAANIIRTELDVPVVYLTAYADELTLQRAKITKPFGYIIKPFEEKELHSTIELSLYNHSLKKKLKESEERYRIVSGMISDFAFSVRIENNNTVLEWLTDSFTGITGYEKKELEFPDGFLDIVHSEDRKNLQKKMKYPFEESKGTIRYRIIAKNGETRWLRMYRTMEFSKGDKSVQRLFGAVRDITEEVKAQSLLEIQRDLGVALSSVTDLSRALDLIVEASLKVGCIDSGGLYIVDPLTGIMRLAAHKGLPSRFVEISSFSRESPQARLVREGKPIYGHYSDVAQGSKQEEESDRLKALCIIPVKYQGEIVAALNLASHRVDKISESSQNAIEAISSQVGGIVDRIENRGR